MDELLALTGDGAEKRTGAEAWEIDYGIRETVKRVPISEAGASAGSGSEHEGRTVAGGRSGGMGRGRIEKSLGRSLGKTNFETNLGKGMQGRRRVGDLFSFGGQDEVEGQDSKPNTAVGDEPRGGGEPVVVDLAERAKAMEVGMERERSRLLPLEVEQERERMRVRERELRERELKEQELREQELRERVLREREAAEEREAARERQKELEI